MQFEDFDKKVRDAAEHHHPAYDEKAWDNMENLLDKHLPVKKDTTRRIFFFLFLFILAGGGAYLWMAKPWKPASITDSSRQTITQPPISPAEKNNDEETVNNNNTEKSNTETNAATEPVNSKNKTASYSVDKTFDQKNEGSVSSTATATDKTDKKRNNLYLKKKIAGAGKTTFTRANSFPKINKNPENNLKIIAAERNDTKISHAENSVANNNRPDNNTNNVTVAITPNTAVISENIIDKADKPLSTDTTATKEATKETVAKNDIPVEKKLSPKKKHSSFAITVSGGPDVSTVGLNNIGKMNCVIGAGLSYTYNRFTLRSGFYAVKKVYTAAPDDYHPPKHSPPTYLNLTKVDGDCKVYEIPVTFSYNFGETKSHSWFGAVGLSSFLMKKETYDYYYKDSNGNPAQKTWSTQDNKHLFSVLNLSAGYEKKLNQNLSLTAEPYFKIPLEGIGYGNIQMNSMGVLISMNIKPFAPRK